MFLMPSHYEPCGLNQIYSLKYGTIPCCSRYRRFDDTIETWDTKTRRAQASSSTNTPAKHCSKVCVAHCTHTADKGRVAAADAHA